VAEVAQTHQAGTPLAEDGGRHPDVEPSRKILAAARSLLESLLAWSHEPGAGSTHPSWTGIEDLLCGFFHVRVTQKDTSNNIERRLPKNRFHVFDHFLVAIRIGKYDLSVLL